jgi:hypothetical protein
MRFHVLDRKAHLTRYQAQVSPTPVCPIAPRLIGNGLEFDFRFAFFRHRMVWIHRTSVGGTTSKELGSQNGANSQRKIDKRLGWDHRRSCEDIRDAPRHLRLKRSFIDSRGPG